MIKDKNALLYGLAGIIVVGFFGMMIALMVIEIPGNQSSAVNMLFGALSGAFGQAVGYFFGSSKGSAEKTDALINKAQ